MTPANRKALSEAVAGLDDCIDVLRTASCSDADAKHRAEVHIAAFLLYLPNAGIDLQNIAGHMRRHQDNVKQVAASVAQTLNKIVGAQKPPESKHDDE